MNRINLMGQTFGRLKVIAEAEPQQGPGRKRTRWQVLCSCGNTKEVNTRELRNGTTRSCGCLRQETSAAQGHSNEKHGYKDTRTYRSWTSMRSRCKYHPRYAGRGIKVCKRWESFENFLADMGERPPGKTLDRENNNGNYNKNNCRWATPKQQQNNRSL